MISIIIPTLNEEKRLRLTLLALTENLTIPYELIVSDGGSFDRTVEIAEEFTKKVVVHKSGSRQTIAGGRNAGAKAAAGEFLVFLDADCQFQNPDLFFNQALSRFEYDKDLVALTTEIMVFPKDETISDQIFSTLLNAYFRLMNNYFYIGEAAGEFQMMKREAYDRVGGYREDLVAHEDSKMFQSLSKIGRTLFEPNLTIYHTGRRAHKIGWPKLLFQMFMNSVYDFAFNRSYSKEWEPIR